MNRADRAIEQVDAVIGLRGVVRRPRLVLGDEVGHELPIGLVGEIVDPIERTRNTEREIL